MSKSVLLVTTVLAYLICGQAVFSPSLHQAMSALVMIPLGPGTMFNLLGAALSLCFANKPLNNADSEPGASFPGLAL